MLGRRHETGHGRQETGDERKEMGGRRRQTGDRKPQTGDGRQELSNVKNQNIPEQPFYFLNRISPEAFLRRYRPESGLTHREQHDTVFRKTNWSRNEFQSQKKKQISQKFIYNLIITYVHLVPWFHYVIAENVEVHLLELLDLLLQQLLKKQ